ncbi:MAG: LacI family DNA-binding transcriptional regulator [Victivallales bacterium]|nr:LacI family DNA-binding transcriptional regulator [Victivallales bacterium]
MTVSKVLNDVGTNHASEKNRERIIAVARSLNYQPDLNARRLVTRRNDVIGLLIDREAPYFHNEVMHILETLALGYGKRIQIGMSHDSFVSLAGYINDFRGNGIRAVVCLSHTYPGFGFKVPPLLEHFERVVFLERPLCPTRFPVVESHHRANFRALTAAMLDKGYRRIISIRANYQDNAFFEAKEGMREAYGAAGVPFEECFWMTMGHDGDRSFEQAGESLALTLPHKPDVLVLSNDAAAMCAIRLLTGRGVSVPRDIAVFSASLSKFAEFTSPALSGIDYHSDILANCLFSRLLGKEPDIGEGMAVAGKEGQLLVPARILWRESCPCG